MRALASLLVLAACGGGSDHPIVFIDSSVDVGTAADAPSGTMINIQSFGGAPEILAVKSGTGAWQALAPTATSFFATSATYQLLAVCQAGMFFETAIAARAVSDGDAFVPCFPFGSSTAPPTPVAITGQVAQAGGVWMGDTATGATSPWSYTLAVPPGAHDLIAANATKIAIQRDLAITVAATEPTVDVAQTGTAFESHGFVLTGLGTGDVVTHEVNWLTANEFAILTGTGAGVSTIPASLLASMTDLEVIDVYATNGMQKRTVEEFVSGTVETTVTLLPPVTATFAGASALWTSLPTGFDSAALSVFGATNGENISATPAYLGAATSLAIDVTGVPGYLPAYDVGTTGLQHVFQLRHTVSQATDVSSSIQDTAALRAASPARSRAAVRHRRHR